MRDERTARHAARRRLLCEGAGDRARAAARSEQDIVHTAGLLHEIGKFTLARPDAARPSRSTDEDLEIVQRHPQEGAILVGALDGYGAVADAILYHHERMDGRGYPAGLIGQEIPLGSGSSPSARPTTR